MRVLLFLMSQMEYENFLRPTVCEIAEALGMKKQNVSRSIKELRERFIITDGPHSSLKNASFGWRGKVKSLRQQQHRENMEFNRGHADADREQAETVS